MKNIVFLASLLIANLAVAQSTFGEISSLPSCEVSGFSSPCLKYEDSKYVIGGTIEVPGCKISCPENKTPVCVAGQFVSKLCGEGKIILPTCKCD